MLTLAINSVRVLEYPLTCEKSWDNGTVSHDFYHALLPKLAEYWLCSIVKIPYLNNTAAGNNKGYFHWKLIFTFLILSNQQSTRDLVT